MTQASTNRVVIVNSEVNTRLNARNGVHPSMTPFQSTLVKHNIRHPIMALLGRCQLVRDLASLIARAASARDAETRTSALQEAQAELARFDSARHPELARALRARMAELDPSFTAV
ncbi:MAG: hypothetical protein SFV21_21020 [Rhodospirillaceae bacterium]|nr:hypothetical protein [Rhodospirillaceae bacterium]